MSLTQDKYTTVSNQDSQPKEDININLNNPFLEQDLGIIIHAYEKNCQEWSEDDYSKVYLYRDVYSTENFSIRAKEQLDYYPGVHQSNNPPKQDPLYLNAKEESDKNINYWNNALDNPDSFMNGLKSRRNTFNYSTILSSESSAKTKAKNIGSMLTECIPCFGRLLDANSLLPDGDLIEIHLLNIKTRTDIIKKIKSLFDDPGLYIDICSLLKLLSGLCPSDLYAILALFTQYLAKLNLEIEFNLDFAMQLVGPMMSPFLDSLSAWLDKWIQLILNPLICVLDHVNESILTLQQSKIPLAEITFNSSINKNSANPMHKNSSEKKSLNTNIGIGDSNSYILEDGIGMYGGVWGDEENERFNTPDSQKYNPIQPSPPTEELQMSSDELKETWSDSYTTEDRKNTDQRWKQLKEKKSQKKYQTPPPLTQTKNDGTRWSKDNIPNSEKYIDQGEFEIGYHPPEKQTKTKPTSEYYITTDLIPAIVETRNILQGGIQYTKDWFQYVTQMSYDLLGTDVGWMSKKTDRTILKSRLIQLIYMIQAILEAISKNGLECGTGGNFNENQMKFILENSMNNFATNNGNKFKVLDNGNIIYGKESVVNKQDNSIKSTTDTSGATTSISTQPENLINTISGDKEVFQVGTPSDTISTESVSQKTTDLIFIKNCFKSVSATDLNEVKKWIADFESRS